MKRKVLVALCSALCIMTLSAALAACGGETINPAENEHTTQYRSDWRGKNDEGIEIDGSLNETCWTESKAWFRTTVPSNTDGNGTYLETTAFTTDLGIYIGAVLHDKNLVGDGQFNVSEGTCLEFYYSFRQADGKIYNNAYYNRDVFFLDLYGNYYTFGTRMKRGVKVDGEINSGNTTSATFEVFIPWEQTNLDTSAEYRPSSVLLLPRANIALSGQSKTNYCMGKVQGRFRDTNQAMYYEFDENGYTKADAENAVLGDAKNGMAKSANWNLERLDEGIISVDKSVNYDYIYFKGGFAENFETSVTMYPGDYMNSLDNGIYYGNSGGGFSKAGFYILSTEGLEYVPRLSVDNLADVGDGVKAPKTYYLDEGDNIFSDSHQSGCLANGVRTATGPLTFKLIKYGSDFFFFADGNYLGTQNISALSGSVYVGLFNGIRSMEFRDYSFRALTAEEAKAAIGNVLVPVSVTAGAGGSVEYDVAYVERGGSFTFDTICNSGYTIDSVTLGEQDITEDFKTNAVRGQYTVNNIMDSAQIEITFKELAQTEASAISGKVFSGERETAAALKFISKENGYTVYSVRATAARGYSVTLPNGTYLLQTMLGTTRTLMQEVVVDGSNDNKNITVQPYESNGLVYTDDAREIIGEISSTSANYAMLFHDSCENFTVSANFKATEASFPAAGFTVYDAYHNSVQFQVVDHGSYNVFRMHVNNNWMGLMEATAPVNFRKTAEGIKECTVTLTCVNDIFSFMMDGKLIASLTRAEINAYINQNVYSNQKEYLHGGPYTLGVFSWEIKEADGRTSSEPIVKFTGFSVTTQFEFKEISGTVTVPAGEQQSGVNVSISDTNGAIVYSGRTGENGNYTAQIPVGTYTVVASNAKYISAPVEFTVTADGTGETISTELSRHALTIETGSVNYNASGHYATNDMEISSTLFNGTLEEGKPFIVETQIKGLSSIGDPGAGILLRTSTKNYLRFFIRRESTDYLFRIFNDWGGNFWYTKKIEGNPFESGSAALKLVYYNGYYFVYLNGEFFDMISENVASTRPDGDGTLAETIGSGTRKFGLTSEHGTEFVTWDYSTDESAIKALLKAEITTPADATLMVDGKIVTDGRVMLGDTVEFKISVQEQASVTVMVDGNAVESVTEGGYLIATFVVTGNNEVTVVHSYSVTGTVMNGNEETVITITDVSAKEIFTGKGASFTTLIPVGTYYLSAESDTYLSIPVQITVNADGTVTGNKALELTKRKITSEHGTFDVTTGSYLLPSGFENYGVIGGATVGQDQAFIVTGEFTDMGNMDSAEPFAGFRISTNSDTYLRFGIRWERGQNKYVFKVWHWIGNQVAYTQDLTLASDAMQGENTVKVAVAYRNGTYHIFLNGELLVSLPETATVEGGTTTVQEAIGVDGNKEIGFFSEHQIRIVDWNFSTESTELANLLARTVNTDKATGVTLTVDGKPVTDGKVMLGDTVTVKLALSGITKYTFKIDGTAIPTENVNNFATATFVVKDNHAITYETSYELAASVTNGDAGTSVRLLSDAGAQIESKTGESVTFEVAAGTYYLSAENDTYLSVPVRITVNADGTVTGNKALELTKRKIGAGTYETTGSYLFFNGTENYGAIAGATVGQDQAFIATGEFTDMGNMDSAEPFAGFRISTNSDTYLRFGIRWERGQNKYVFKVWHWIGNQVAYTQDLTLASDAMQGENTVKVAIAYKDGTYHIFLNGELLVSLSETATIEGGTTVKDAIGASGNKEIGFFSEHQIKIVDWDFSTDSADIDHYFVSTEITVGGSESATAKLIAGGAEYTLTEGKWSGTLPVGTKVYAQSENYLSEIKSISASDSAVALTLSRGKITPDHGSLDAASGSYLLPNGYENYGAIYGAAATQDQSFLVFGEFTDMGNMSTNEPFAGFRISTNSDTYLRFGIRWERGQNKYVFKVWHWIGNQVAYTQDLTLASDAMQGENTVKVAIAYKDGTYHIFLNGELLVSLSETATIEGGTTVKDAIGASGNKEIGFFSEHQIKIVDWDFSTDSAEIESYLSAHSGS